MLSKISEKMINKSVFFKNKTNCFNNNISNFIMSAQEEPQEITTAYVHPVLAVVKWVNMPHGDVNVDGIIEYGNGVYEKIDKVDKTLHEGKEYIVIHSRVILTDCCEITCYGLAGSTRYMAGFGFFCHNESLRLALFQHMGSQQHPFEDKGVSEEDLTIFVPDALEVFEKKKINATFLKREEYKNKVKTIGWIFKNLSYNSTLHRLTGILKMSYVKTRDIVRGQYEDVLLNTFQYELRHFPLGKRVDNVVFTMYMEDGKFILQVEDAAWVKL